MSNVEEEKDVPETSSPVVRYSVKELFGIINVKLDGLVQLAESKASQLDLDALGARVDRNTEQIDSLIKGLVARADTNASRIQKLEDSKVTKSEVWRTVATTFGIFVATLSALAAVVALIVHLLGA